MPAPRPRQCPICSKTPVLVGYRGGRMRKNGPGNPGQRVYTPNRSVAVLPRSRSRVGSGDGKRYPLRERSTGLAPQRAL
eukprot:gene18054-biopygen12937